MMKMKSIIFTILALFCLVTLKAQNTAKTDTLLNRELMLEKEYTPTLRDAVKLSQLPELREPQATKSAVEFSNYAIPFALQPKLLPLSPQSYLTKLNYSKYRGYLTAGLSSLLDINGDLGYQILNSNKDRLNIFFSHRSSRSNVSYLQDVSDLDETGKQKFKINDNWGGLNFMHDFSGIKLLADAKYTWSAFNYYGLSIPYYPPIPLMDFTYNNNFDKNTNQINNLFEMNIGIAYDESDELNYKINAGYTNFRQKYSNLKNDTEESSKENRFLIDADFHKLINSTMGIGLSGSLKSYSNSKEIFKALYDSITNYLTFSLNPYIYLEGENLNLILGAKVDFEIEGRKKIVVSPNVHFNYFPSDKFLLYIIAEGGRNDNSQYNMFYENRYVDPLFRVMDSRSPLDATVGVKFLPFSTLDIGVFGGYKITKDEHFYYSNFGSKFFPDMTIPMLAGSWITPDYKDANTLKVGAEIKYAYQNIFELGLKGTYYKWDISPEQDPLWIMSSVISSSLKQVLSNAWNKPDFEMNANVAYSFPMLPLRLDLSYIGAYGRKAASNPDRSELAKMKDIHDLTLKGTYSFTPNFSAYLSLNNLLFSKYDFWWGYPAQGFNIMGGLSVLF